MHTLKRWLDHIGAALFLAMFLTFVLQICARFVFNQPLPWTDELAVVLYIWSIFWACAFMVPAASHVSLDLLIARLADKPRRWLQTLGDVLLGSLALQALPASWDYLLFMQREATAVMGLPLFWVFLPLLVLLLMLVLRGAWQMIQLVRTDP
jgi:TRAP-type C4-dicarboxylate transport system permease small subunit